jgi:hypothetical protein
MYESKKNSGRKDIYKYQKSSHQKIFHNSTHFGYHKHNKYKQKYNYSNSIQDFDEETIFSKIFDDNKSTKKDDLKELDELTPTPTIKYCKTLTENKENICLSSNINELETEMKTNNVNNSDESCKNEINEIISSVNNLSCQDFSENFLIIDKIKDKENEGKNGIIEDINKFNTINNENINNLNINFNVKTSIKDLLIKGKECIFSSNEKEDIHLQYNKNIHKTPQPFKANSSPINISSNDMKDAFYIPKKLNNLYDKYASQQTNFFDRRHNSINSFNFMTIQKPKVSLSNKQIPNYNNLGISNNININYYENNNNNSTNFLQFNNGNNSLNISNDFNVPNSPNLAITSFNLFESNNINNLGNINLPNLQQFLNNNNSHHNLSTNPFHNMMPQFELNKCILKTQINNNNLFEKDKENTDILEINVKITDNETLTFKIRRYDDMFKTVKIFCEINKLDIKLMRPFIIYIIKALNSIYGIYNINLRSDEIQLLKDIKTNFYNEEETADINEDVKEKEKNDKHINNDLDKVNNLIDDSEEDSEKDDDNPEQF